MYLQDMAQGAKAGSQEMTLYLVPVPVPANLCCCCVLQVYVLSRMGNSRAALRLIIRNQQDIPRAIEFVRLQQDEELWEELIDWALSSADTTGALQTLGCFLCCVVLTPCNTDVCGFVRS